MPDRGELGLNYLRPRRTPVDEELVGLGEPVGTNRSRESAVALAQRAVGVGGQKCGGQQCLAGRRPAAEARRRWRVRRSGMTVMTVNCRSAAVSVPGSHHATAAGSLGEVTQFGARAARRASRASYTALAATNNHPVRTAVAEATTIASR